MIASLRFKRAIGSEEAKRIRRNETEDIVRRYGVISPNRITIHNYPVSLSLIHISEPTRPY